MLPSSGVRNSLNCLLKIGQSAVTSVRHYDQKVLDHYENPQNVGSFKKDEANVGTGLVGAPACGDVLKLQIKVDDNGNIIDARFKTFGCASAIASSSLATELIIGKKLNEAEKIKNTVIAQELKLPPVKLHCSMLAEDAIKAAISDYKKKSNSKSDGELKQMHA
ncbi:iron-sulfur cluster assembly enzyme [Brevipalpus obovatus]|uniref:iron-sulfur cluster assembly enzyme n=1 Tax=Brevipalpus obovatus TaxID=246614 RepID=UPI003D9E17D2